MPAAARRKKPPFLGAFIYAVYPQSLIGTAKRSSSSPLKLDFLFDISLQFGNRQTHCTASKRIGFAPGSGL